MSVELKTGGGYKKSDNTTGDISNKELAKYPLKFIDSLNFMGSSLDTLSKNLVKDNHPFDMLSCFMHSKGHTADVVNMLKKKGFFPYEYLDSFEKLSETCLPPISRFYSTLTESTITQQQYAFACKLFEDSKCKSIRDYLILYLETDVYLLAEVFQNFRNKMFHHYKLDPLGFITLPGLSIQSALLSADKEIFNLPDIETYSVFEGMVRGGYSATHLSYEAFNTPHCKDYDPTKEITSGGFVDVNSLYPTILVGKLPVGRMHELTHDEIESFDIASQDIDGEFAYSLMVDYEIPDDVKRKTDNFPLSMHHQTTGLDDVSEFTHNLILDNNSRIVKAKRLVCTHHPREKYMIALPLLQHHVLMGMIVTKIHRIFRFEQSACFADYIKKNIEMRRNATDETSKLLIKLMSNSLFGRLMLNLRNKYIETYLITQQKEFEKYIEFPRLRECVPISESKMLIKLDKQKIKLTQPIHVGAYILDLSKKFMYEYYYNVLKKHYGESVELMYTDTDSFLFKLTGFTFEDEMMKEPIRSTMDFSNFPTTHKCYDNSNKGVLGYLKSEMADKIISEAILLQSKCYSVQTIDAGFTKSACKGIVSRKQRELTHELYKDIHNLVTPSYSITSANIIKRKNKLSIVTTTKRALTKIDLKRYWIDSVTSYAFGHPDILNTSRMNPVSKTVTKRKTSSINRQLNFNHKKAKPGMMLYNTD